ncbi:hypothetical protein L9F63_010928 [Diploptera punctata]|uniref:Uncharacterized protein n=1 Tax=Diploptera punctata TaxID=6984 RepID=A0AAD8EQ86_DIPPU|nr:hypothetical protein L9F63_010928 [Diploptera punctata]
MGAYDLTIDTLKKLDAIRKAEIKNTSQYLQVLHHAAKNTVIEIQTACFITGKEDYPSLNTSVQQQENKPKPDEPISHPKSHRKENPTESTKGTENDDNEQSEAGVSATTLEPEIMETTPSIA